MYYIIKGYIDDINNFKKAGKGEDVLTKQRQKIQLLRQVQLKMENYQQMNMQDITQKMQIS